MTLNDIINDHQLLNSSSYGTDKGTIHSYIDVYESLFSDFRDKPISLLEIGIRQGASLFLWSKYFKENSSIIGIDTDQANIVDMWKSDQIKHIIENAYDTKIFDQLTDTFDIIIDDGPHTLESQCFFLKHYVEKLNPNGLLIIEDIQSMTNAQILKDILPKSMNKNIEIIDLIHKKNRYDDILMVYRNPGCTR